MTADSSQEHALQEGRRLFDEGLREFREGGYFEAHDLWEEFWQELRGSDRRFLQGLIHLAVGTYHLENGNERGAHSQLRKAMIKTGEYPPGHWGVDRSEWMLWIEQYLDGSVSPHPRTLPFAESQFPATLPMAPVMETTGILSCFANDATASTSRVSPP